MKGDRELRQDYIKVDRQASATNILVCVVTWSGPHTPEGRWEIGRELRPEATGNDIEEAIQSLLGDARFFGVCSHCGERNQHGHMHSETICQSCAESDLGVDY